MNRLFEFFIKLFKFIPILWNYRTWDYSLILATMKASTELMINSYEKSEAPLKDILELKRFVALLDKQIKDEYFLNMENYADIKKSMQEEDDDWNELCSIFKGDKEKEKYGIKSWWT